MDPIYIYLLIFFFASQTFLTTTWGNRPARPRKLKVQFPAGSPDYVPTLMFVDVPSAGDFVRTQKHSYIVRRVTHVPNEGLKHLDPDIEIYLEPADSD